MRGCIVTEVTMIKVSDRKLSGLVHFEMVDPVNKGTNGHGDPFVIANNGAPVIFTKSCTAEMADDGKQYIWKCE